METEKDDVLDCRIEDMGVYGEGITHVGGQTVFFPGAITGERVSARVVLAKPTLAHAVLERIIETSPSRAEPPCPYFKQCGGCSLQHVSYPFQLALKRDIVRVAFRKYAGIDADVAETTSSPEIFGYRNKLSLPVRRYPKKGTVRGLFAKKTHRIVEIGDCMLQKPGIFAAAEEAFEFAMSQGLKGYDETDGSGDLRHIVVRSIGGVTAVTFVLNGERQRFCDALADKYSSAVGSVFININTARNNVILGDTTIPKQNKTWGLIDGMPVSAHPQAFFQVNDGVREKLYAAVTDRVDSYDTVVDAYCGGGLMSALLARKAKRVIGVEISEAAVDCAEVLRKSQKAENLSFICGDCAVKLPEVFKEIASADRTAVVLDPPKSGCQGSVIDSVLGVAPEKIVYVSCNPATLARDCALFVRGGYDLAEVTPFDMFPQTTSVETLVVLGRK